MQKSVSREISLRPPNSLSQQASQCGEEIEQRAYEIYLARGCVDGYDQDDWLQAEREIREAPSRRSP